MSERVFVATFFCDTIKQKRTTTDMSEKGGSNSGGRSRIRLKYVPGMNRFLCVCLQIDKMIFLLPHC